MKKAATGEADQERCVILGHYIVENNATVRAAAKKFGVSKSTVHQDITAKLAQVDRHLHDEVKAVLEKNKQERQQVERFPLQKQKPVVRFQSRIIIQWQERGAVPPKNEPENKMKKALPKGGL